jgi:hypothetical protein
VVVLDDMVHLATKSPDALHLFQTMASHGHVTAFLLSQNLYPPKGLRQEHPVKLSARGSVQERERLSSDHHLRQSGFYGSLEVLDGRLRQGRPYGYMLVDLTNHCPEDRRLRTNVLPTEGETIVYLSQ